jgi:hypothetical protein
LLGPGLGPDGRLRPHGHWSYLFRSAQRPAETFLVEVPCFGAIRSSLSLPPHPSDPALDDDWLDSDRVLAIAEEHGGRAARDQSEKLAFDVVASRR